ncbi:MAG: phosphate transport regulator [Aquabacterium sp.]|nr:phosphate transport regulator [Aquabacterium sp.]
MQKAEAVAALGSSSLSLPAWVRAALGANDRLKLYLSVLQAAAAHADHPERAALDLSREMAAAGVVDDWLHDLPASASRAGEAVFIPDLARLLQRLAEDLQVMARPVLASPGEERDALQARVTAWSDRLTQRATAAQSAGGERLEPAELHDLTHGDRHAGGSLHILVMDLHKALNRLSAALASDNVAGAHAWGLDAADRPRVEAFMRGLQRTAPLKFDHPGLDTAATRDGARLLLQNDIGTNDAHVLVIQVEGLRLQLTYSDLHRSRFAFFQDSLSELGAQWSVVEPRISPGLNRGEAYFVGTAQFNCADEPALLQALEGLGARIVFLIDWNRARKRLLPFVDKDGAIAVLHEAARREAGHMAWLKAGAEQLIFGAMQVLGEGAFRIGDRLDEVLGEAAARSFLVEVLSLASTALRAGQPQAAVADQTRLLLLARQMQRRMDAFDLLAEHAAYCHALAQSVRDGLAHGVQGSRHAADDLAARAKAWERRADHLVMQARDRAERLPRWRPVVRLLEQADDVADALEEAAHLLSLIADDHAQGWHADVRQVLHDLAATVLSATQEHIKAVEVARNLGAASEDGPGGDAGGTFPAPATLVTGGVDSDAFVAATWNVVRAERRCDELLRSARRTLLHRVQQPAALMLANDLAQALEGASDHLLSAAYALRDLAFDRVGAVA